jgi:hypothetical protein
MIRWMSYPPGAKASSVLRRALVVLVLVCLGPTCESVGVSSPPPPPPPPVVDSPWVWMAGNNNCNQAGAYGTLGVADPANYPGGRCYAASWKDTAGNFWVFGGITIVNWGPYGYLSDLWKFDGTNWTWVSGSNASWTGGTWGTLRVANPANIPSGRGGSMFARDAGGNLWLFGGTGVLSTGNLSSNRGNLSDLWKFDGINWTWMSGPIALDQGATYGVQGVADPANMPGAHSEGAAWVDKSGSFWLFGGTDASQSWNDLWKFDGTNWTWVSGASGPSAVGVYGTQGTAAASNVPGARWGAASWTDPSGNFWLFGGSGADGVGNVGNLSDLWKFDGTQWTWIGGPDTANPPFVPGVQGVPAVTNSPGGRLESSAWLDALGNQWIFGGNYSSDLWTFDGVNWTWMAGPSATNQRGVVGTLGVPGPGNVPGGRHGANSWLDGSGKLWMFGGYGYDPYGTLGMMTDLWRYTPP